MQRATADTATDPVESPPVWSRYSRFLIVIGIGLYCAGVWYVGWHSIRDKLVSADLPLVGVAAATIGIATWFRALKWRYALGGQNHGIALYFVSKSTANWTPGRLSEFAPLLFSRHRNARVGGWIMYDRLQEIFVTLALGLTGLYLIRFVPVPVFAVLSLGAAIGFGFGVYLLTRSALLGRWKLRFAEGGVLYRLLDLCERVSGELSGFTNKLLLTLAITVATKCADIWAVALIFRAIQAQAGFALVAAAKCALAIVSFLPITPTATGMPHATQAWLMNEVAGIGLDSLLIGIGIEVVIVSATFWLSFGLASVPIARAFRSESGGN